MAELGTTEVDVPVVPAGASEPAVCAGAELDVELDIDVELGAVDAGLLVAGVVRPAGVLVVLVAFVSAAGAVVVVPVSSAAWATFTLAKVVPTMASAVAVIAPTSPRLLVCQTRY
ncbi:hypothetical protein FC83_GL003278 [Agrilactobacillus composti DSM 18527 = JCM 14202]|uniref:Uncharacterized protein n=1 Tax=Agrilactobacillus composti DSM 18527 = JCM 14202 TaxID=1423734 RepID=X0PV62_9LACO|nr:hypothetical protein FC83_GL003278 [Agrilactobacillus composti DSM 18527 = JCM 14202]GAF42032.1 hypothetical protein JCM14202_4030 [Agrilactobacillus composti DSM 18527 = JCM 14202]